MTALYERLAGDLELSIRHGALAHGEKLPSLRELSKERAISVSTVIQAYLLLEARGLVEARDRSGFYVHRPACALPTSKLPAPHVGSVEVVDLILEVLGAARDPASVPLGAGVPGVELMPTREISQLLAKVCREHPELMATYAFAPGLIELRRQIARDSGRFGCVLDPEEIVTASGGMEALNLCLRAVARPGDAIAIESPTYFGILQMVESLGMRAVELPTDPVEGVALADVELAVREHGVKACVFVTSFHNPLGGCPSEDRKRELVELLARLQVPLIEDDVFGDLAFDGSRPAPCKAFDRTGNVLWIGSFSKTVGAGLRVGWCAPGRYRREVLALRGATSLANTAPVELAIALFLERGGYRRHLRTLRQHLATQMELARAAVIRHFPAGTRLTSPRGGLVLWVELPDGTDATLLYQRAMRENIAFMPGQVFSASGRFRNCLRLSYAAAWSPAVERGIARIGELAHELVP